MTATEVLRRQDLWMRDVFIPSRDKILRKVAAFARFLLMRNHAHHWVHAAEVVEVGGLGARLQHHRFCCCGRKQYLVMWWNQFKEVCY